MATPVSVLRLPKGPDLNSRGFDPNSPRFIALCRTSIPTSAAAESDPKQLAEEQHARSLLRERFLRCLLAMTNKKVQFHMHEQVNVEATFGASDIDVLNFQVSDLYTPIGVQKEALIRCQDVISFTFDETKLKEVLVLNLLLSKNLRNLIVLGLSTQFDSTAVSQVLCHLLPDTLPDIKLFNTSHLDDNTAIFF